VFESQKALIASPYAKVLTTVQLDGLYDPSAPALFDTYTVILPVQFAAVNVVAFDAVTVLAGAGVGSGVGVGSVFTSVSGVVFVDLGLLDELVTVEVEAALL